MIKIVLFFAFCFGISSGYGFDPRKFDYCPKKCASHLSSLHSACKCEIEGTREVVVDDFVHFRTSMVDLHNAYRNELAKGGEETKHGFPKAANMHVINYDLELEYIANCYAKRIYNEHDQCRSKHDTEINTGQNIYVFGKKVDQEDFDSYFNKSVESWYEEIQYVTDLSIVDKFRKDDSVKSSRTVNIGHFTQITWAAVRSIGCARVFIDKNHKNPIWRYILFCNYAGRKEEGYSGNIRNFPIYKKGEPCSQCPKGEKCNKEYGGKWDSLCGESEAIPTRVPYGFEGKLPSGTDAKNPDSTNAIAQVPDFKNRSTKAPDSKIPTSETNGDEGKLPSGTDIKNPDSTIANFRTPDLKSRSTKAPDSKIPTSNGGHKIFVNGIFVIGVVVLSFY